jgi:hypothetical protein
VNMSKGGRAGRGDANMNNFSCIDEFVTTGLDILVNRSERAKVDTGAALGSFFLGVPRCRRCNASSDVSVSHVRDKLRPHPQVRCWSGPFA